MEIRASNQTNGSQISIDKFAGPLTRCIIAVIILTTSTGLLIRKLIANTLAELVACTVGISWLAGDLLLCLAIIIVLHDVLIVSKRDDEQVLIVRGKSLSFLDIVTILFCCLYLLDLIIFLHCTLRPRADCQATLTHYRYIFFHIQLYISLFYITKPWKWAKLDIGQIMNWFNNFILFLQRLYSSMNLYVNHFPQSNLNGPISIKSSNQSSSVHEPQREGHNNRTNVRPKPDRAFGGAKSSRTSDSRNKVTRSKRIVVKSTPGTRIKRPRTTRKQARSIKTKAKRRVVNRSKRGSSAIKIFQQTGNLVRVEVVQ